MATDSSAKNSGEGGRSDIKVLLIAMALLTVVAAAGGWLAGAKLNMVAAPAATVAVEENGQQITADSVTANGSITVLPPILTNLGTPSTTWVRLESALVARPGEKISPELAAEISSDFLAYLRAIPLADISGPTGLMYLREDLLDRAQTRSKGKISYVLISGLVVEQ